MATVEQAARYKEEAASTATAENVSQLCKIMKDCRNCMFISVNHEGEIHSRPMACANIEMVDNTTPVVWFVTYKDSYKCFELERNGKASLSFQKDASQEWASVSVKVDLVTDREKARQVWHPSYTAYLPGGIDDPNLVLLKCTPIHAMYWEASKMSRAYVAFGSIKAKLTGVPITHPGQAQEIGFKSK